MHGIRFILYINLYDYNEMEPAAVHESLLSMF